MRLFIDSVRKMNTLKSSIRKSSISAIGCVALVLLTAGLTALGQTPSTPLQPEAKPAATSDPPGPHDISPVEPTGLAAALKAAPHSSDGSINEEQMRQLLVNKMFYLRGAYLDNSLDFNEQGKLIGNSPRGSYTLSGIRINKVKFSKRRMQLEGDRYALHFLGELPHQDPLKDVVRVKITPKRKVVKISIDREPVEKPRKRKHKSEQALNDGSTMQVASVAPGPPNPAAQSESQASISDTSSEGKHSSTTSPEHASQTLVNALDRVFAPEIDDRMIAGMPDFWKLYYKAAAANVDYVQTDSGVFSQNAVDQKAKLLSTVEPPSSELAQSNGIAGMALYHTVIGQAGNVEDVVAVRPIGFGLDEGAVEALRRAKFQPAMKEGKPVPVALDMVVSFRIYSNRTSQPAVQQAGDGPAQPVLPGPYSVQRQ